MDELNIVYLVEDTFAFITYDTSTIEKYAELINTDNEDFIDTCEATEQLIFKYKGKQVFSAQVSTEIIKDIISCINVSYVFDSKRYRHRLTYGTSMGIDNIYEHKVNPRGNPWGKIDSSKFHYEDVKSIR